MNVQKIFNKKIKYFIPLIAKIEWNATFQETTGEHREAIFLYELSRLRKFRLVFFMSLL